MQNNRSGFKKIVFVLAFFLFSGFIPAAYAQADLVTAVNQVRASIEAIVKTAAYYIFQVTPNVPATISTNYARNNSTGTPVAATVTTLNTTDIQNGINPNINNPTANLTTLAAIQASDTVLTTGSLGGILPWGSSAAQQTAQQALTQGNLNFNLQSLLTPHVYNTSQNQNTNALNFIRFISGYAVPISNLNLSQYDFSGLSTFQKNKAITEIQSSPDYQNFLVQRRALVAQQTVGLSTLYNIYAKRLPIQNIAAGDTALNVANPSALQIEDYISEWRSSTPSWYQQMETAPPTTLARETLYVLVEIQRELHGLRLDQERLLALTAINQLGGLNLSKTTLGLQETKATALIESKIAAQKQTKQQQTQQQGQATSSNQQQRLQTQEQQVQQTQQGNAAQQGQAPASQQGNQSQ